ncbi:hypothetical protein T265_10163 [Opisthorchis viverrini]|uniref:Uncharacterized protein n=1 Tax=Opisthorchis viverrini TaxID=6198 RepID=A0A074ZEA2_OPIVI|nr:hypothetical protein T265_10163 [Opisthorchis viverrini]KER21540.1 hypothetical protein T265_10163 [Opisthorchis viverrini]
MMRISSSHEVERAVSNRLRAIWSTEVAQGNPQRKRKSDCTTVKQQRKQIRNTEAFDALFSPTCKDDLEE